MNIYTFFWGMNGTQQIKGVMRETSPKLSQLPHGPSAGKPTAWTWTMMPWKMKNNKPPIFGFQPLIFGDVQYHFHQVEICYWWFLSLKIVLQFHGVKTKKLSCRSGGNNGGPGFVTKKQVCPWSTEGIWLKEPEESTTCSLSYSSYIGRRKPSSI